MMQFEKRGAGPPVVLVHGLGASSFSWRDTAAALAARHTTYTVDLIGFGRSPTSPGFPSTMAAQAEAVSAFIQAQGLAQPDLVGHSMGSGVCLRLAAEAGRGGWPGVGKLALLAPVAYPPARPIPGSDPRDLVALSGGLGLGALADLPPGQIRMIGRLLAERFLRSVCAPGATITEEQIAGYGEGLSSAGQIQAFIDHARNIGQVAVSPESLRGITAPTLIIWGTEDRLIQRQQAEDLKQAIAGAELREIPSCGHIPHEEHPAEVNRLIDTFLM